jgi:hypothetical protein
MSLKLKYFTVEEADALLPKISEILQAVLETKIRIELKVEEWRKAHPQSSEADEAVFRGQVDFLAAHLEEQLSRITELGAIPKDLDSGLVDFPARIDDREGYLCWKIDEPRITHWHGLTEGFGGRKALKRHEDKNEKKRS